MVYEDNVAERIFQNGIDLIRLGIGDAECAEKGDAQGRYLTAILNIYAGALLLLKSKLADVSAKDGNALIYSKFSPRLNENGRICWKPSERTVDFDQIKERMKQLDLPVLEEVWPSLVKLQEFRNAAEHKFVDLGQELVIGHLFSAHEIIATILRGVVRVSPKTAFGSEWKKLSSMTELAKKFTGERDAKFKELEWLNPRLYELAKLHSCPVCGYPILLVSAMGSDHKALSSTFKCASCQATFEYSEMMDAILQSQKFDDLGGRWKDEYLADRHIGICPDCGLYGFDTETNMCYCCGFENEYLCGMCGEKLTIDEVEETVSLGSGVAQCFHCRYIMEKDD